MIADNIDSIFKITSKSVRVTSAFACNNNNNSSVSALRRAAQIDEDAYVDTRLNKIHPMDWLNYVRLSTNQTALLQLNV